MATASISGELLTHVRTCLQLSASYVRTKRGVRHGTNAYTPHAFPAYVCAVAAIEAFINERLMSRLARAAFPDSALWDLEESLETMRLAAKLVVVPRLLFGRSFDRGAQPFQDFALLIKVRNTVVHFTMEMKPPSYIRILSERGIALTAVAAPEGADYAWPHKLSSTEGIRWAHNSTCRIIAALVEFIPSEHRLGVSASHFHEISAQDMQALMDDLRPE